MKIEIETINHHKQDYPTVGNYWMDKNGNMQIRVSNMGNETYEAMIAIHELIEFVLLRERGVTDEEITKFDLEFEERLKQNKNGLSSEPGFAHDSPYLKEHTLAMSVEMQICALCGINWDEYNNTISKLYENTNVSPDDKKTIALL